MPEIFSYWLQGGRIDVGFLGAAQIDRYGNLNTTVIGSYRRADGAACRAPAAHPRSRCGVEQVFVMLPPPRRARSSAGSTFTTSLGATFAW